MKSGTECSRFPACNQSGLTDGACCPTAEGTMLGCCQGAVETIVNDPPLMGSECIHFPRCVELGLTGGNCCPSRQGAMMDCCTHQNSSHTQVATKEALCVNNARCEKLGLRTGACCPDMFGTYLDCC